MRLWSVHPRYIDGIGLVALWRESLLAQKVLLNQTRGYKSHPQLLRFRNTDDPIMTIGYYLDTIVIEAAQRGYKFDEGKIISRCPVSLIPVEQGQIEYEWRHLLDKLKQRSPLSYEKLKGSIQPASHPLFYLVEGGIAPWEKIIHRE